MTELRAAYRLQLGPGLRFADARALVPYLRELGISHLYLSPSLQARAGSTHGYDVVDPARVSEELGGEAELRALAAEGLGVILDIVPNHMGTGDENRWWPDPEVFDIDPETGFCRRFFDIDDLGAIRQESETVFRLTHGKVLELVADGVLDGLRVDHPDGLADPAGYLERLTRGQAPYLPVQVPVWVEKILHPGEPLRDWPVEGTVGYEFLNDAQALFVDPAGEEPLTRVYAELTGETRDFAAVAYEAQVQQATTVFHRELDWLARTAPRRVEGVAEALAALPVYRTYVEPWSGRIDDLDREYVAGLPQDIQRILLLQEGDGWTEWITRFQQFSPPVTAKGIEDTAFYRYNRLVALNEVGGDPGRFGISVEVMHAANAERAHRFPRNLLITSTHDTKRSADVRARIGALSTMPQEWERFVRRVFELAPPPDANECYMILQNLVGAWPIEPLGRLDAYIEKALREEKVHSSWAEVNEEHERRVVAWARGLLSEPEVARALAELVERAEHEGRRSALGQLLLKLTAPGVPDVYGGDELEFRALVDPDNRRTVDWEARRAMLTSPAAEPKFQLIRAALALRARRPGAFAGAYIPVDAGPGVCAYLRGEGEVLVVIPLRDWQGASLRYVRGRYRDALRPGREVELRDGIAVADALSPLGVGLLARAG